MATPAPHPIDILIDEHRTILAVLADMERECGHIGSDAVLDEGFWRRTLRFLEEFDDRLHHGKEEGVLFPALEAAGLSPHVGATSMLRSEHGRCCMWRGAIADAVAHGDRLSLLEAVQGLVDLQRQHIARENLLLFPLARHLLSPATFAAMARSFAALDDGVIPVVAGRPRQ
jgi:hemerythrin-like domain-containing protein